MSYGVHIIRIDPLASGKSQPIPLNEWLEYVASDSEMHLKGEAAFKSPKGDEIRVNAPGLAEWIDLRDGSHTLFDHTRGRVSVGNPSRVALVKMFQIAQKLNAIVRGDEGEIYDVMGSVASR